MALRRERENKTVSAAALGAGFRELGSAFFISTHHLMPCLCLAGGAGFLSPIHVSLTTMAVSGSMRGRSTKCWHILGPCRVGTLCFPQE